MYIYIYICVCVCVCVCMVSEETTGGMSPKNTRQGRALCSSMIMIADGTGMQTLCHGSRLFLATPRQFRAHL